MVIIKSMSKCVVKQGQPTFIAPRSTPTEYPIYRSGTSNAMYIRAQRRGDRMPYKRYVTTTCAKIQEHGAAVRAAASSLMAQNDERASTVARALRSIDNRARQEFPHAVSHEQKALTIQDQQQHQKLADLADSLLRAFDDLDEQGKTAMWLWFILTPPGGGNRLSRAQSVAQSLGGSGAVRAQIHVTPSVQPCPNLRPGRHDDCFDSLSQRVTSPYANYAMVTYPDGRARHSHRACILADSLLESVLQPMVAPSELARKLMTTVVMSVHKGHTQTRWLIAYTRVLRYAHGELSTRQPQVVAKNNLALRERTRVCIVHEHSQRHFDEQGYGRLVGNMEMIALCHSNEHLISFAWYSYVKEMLHNQNTRVLFVYELLTLEQFRGMGYASSIIGELKQMATADGLAVMLYCKHCLVKFYQTHGFEKVDSDQQTAIMVHYIRGRTRRGV